jgi:hypothetical protein
MQSPKERKNLTNPALNQAKSNSSLGTIGLAGYHRDMCKHFFRSLILFVGVCSSLLLVPVSARTLFIDFNNAENEIAVFRASQQGVASEVVVVPSYQRISHKQRLHIVKVNQAIESYTLKLQDCAVAEKFEKKRDKKCDSYYDKVYSLEQEREKTTAYYSAEDLKKELLALLEDKKTVPFDMVVISGHHEQGFYRGELTDAKVKEFVDMMDESRALFSKVNTVVFLGCETGTKAVFQNTLLNMFPTVPVILASEDNAPTRNEARNLAYIRHVVSIRPKLLAARTVKEVQPLYNSLLAKHWPASLLWRQNIVFFKESTELL